MALLVRTVSTISSTGVLHILQDVLHDVLGDMLVLVVYAYSGSATSPCLFALVDECVSRACHECCECMY